MRLAPLGLMLCFPLLAQGGPRLPWRGLAPLAWQPVLHPPEGAVPPPPAPSTGSLRVQVSPEGTLRVVDARGVIRLRAGLPGRPRRAWRDGGVPLEAPTGTWRFPARTPLAQGIGTLQWCATDFRPFLDGLLWILCDGGAVLAVVHPATGEILYLPLPPGRSFTLRLLPDRLEVDAERPEPGSASRWFLPWIALLPRLAELGPRPRALPRGTALDPFPSQ